MAAKSEISLRISTPDVASVGATVVLSAQGACEIEKAVKPSTKGAPKENEIRTFNPNASCNTTMANLKLPAETLQDMSKQPGVPAELLLDATTRPYVKGGQILAMRAAQRRGTSPKFSVKKLNLESLRTSCTGMNDWGFMSGSDSWLYVKEGDDHAPPHTIESNGSKYNGMEWDKEQSFKEAEEFAEKKTKQYIHPFLTMDRPNPPNRPPPPESTEAHQK